MHNDVILEADQHAVCGGAAVISNFQIPKKYLKIFSPRSFRYPNTEEALRLFQATARTHRKVTVLYSTVTVELRVCELSLRIL
jgi:hypothetical protein